MWPTLENVVVNMSLPWDEITRVRSFVSFIESKKKIICLPVINCERIISGGYSAPVATKTSEFIVFFSCARRVKVGG